MQTYAFDLVRYKPPGRQNSKPWNKIESHFLSALQPRSHSPCKPPFSQTS